MMRRLMLVFAIAGPSALSAQAAADSGHRHLTSHHGAVSFVVPSAWHVLAEDDSEPVARFIYHIRNPATDSNSSDRTNVIIDVQRHLGPHEFTASSDTLLGMWMDSSLAVLGDTTPSPFERTLFWEGHQGKTPYAGFDDIAQSGDDWVHVRIVIAMSDKTSGQWDEQLEKDTEAFVHSILFGTKLAFPADYGYPVLTSFGGSQ